MTQRRRKEMMVKQLKASDIIKAKEAIQNQTWEDIRKIGIEFRDTFGLSESETTGLLFRGVDPLPILAKYETLE